MSEEKRRTPRLPLKIALTLKSAVSTQPVITENVSQGGLLVVLDQLVPVNESVAVEFDLGGGKVIATARVVRHHRESAPGGERVGVGLEFDAGAVPSAWEELLKDLSAHVQTNTTGSERRRFTRFNYSGEIELTSKGKLYNAKGIDASLGGVSLSAPALPLSVNSKVDLRLFDGKTDVVLSATVRRTLPSPYPGSYGFGLEFSAMPPDKLRDLGRFFKGWLAKHGSV